MLRSSVDTNIGTVSELKSPYRCNIADGIWYYDILEEVDNPPQIYKYLLSRAKEKVWIWDPYTNPEDHVLFKYIDRIVDVRCLTFWGCNPKTGNIPKCRQLFLDKIKEVQFEYKFNLEVKYYNVFKNSQINNPFHDRYLFIDNDIYSVGSSMGYHHEDGGKISSTSIHLIKGESSSNLIKKKFLEVWNNKNTEMALKLIGGAI